VDADTVFEIGPVTKVSQKTIDHPYPELQDLFTCILQPLTLA
jgi:hypothetical protein